jgi:hypothetical protein
MRVVCLAIMLLMFGTFTADAVRIKSFLRKDDPSAEKPAKEEGKPGD